jgi:hypothetical protein
VRCNRRKQKEEAARRQDAMQATVDTAVQIVKGGCVFGRKIEFQGRQRVVQSPTD